MGNRDQVNQELENLYKDKEKSDREFDKQIKDLREKLKEDVDELFKPIIGHYFLAKSGSTRYIKVLSAPQKEYTVMETIYKPNEIPVIIFHRGSVTMTNKLTIQETTIRSNAYRLGLEEFYANWVEISKEQFYHALECVIEQIK